MTPVFSNKVACFTSKPRRSVYAAISGDFLRLTPVRRQCWQGLALSVERVK